MTLTLNFTIQWAIGLEFCFSSTLTFIRIIYSQHVYRKSSAKTDRTLQTTTRFLGVFHNMGRVMYFRVWFSLCIVLLWSQQTFSKSVLEININDTISNGQKFAEMTLELEKYFKSAVKSVTKSMLPSMMTFQEDATISRDCLQALMKYVMNLSKAKMWAVQSKYVFCTPRDFLLCI